MEFHLKSLLKGMWGIIKTGYIAPQNGPPQTPDEIKYFENNTKVRVAIVSFLSDEVFDKVVGLKIPKEIWDKLRSVYKVDLKTK